MINYGYDGDELGSNSIKDGDFGSCTDDNYFFTNEEEKMSNTSKTSKNSFLQLQTKNI